MKLRVTLKKGRRLVTTEIEINRLTIIELMEDNIVLNILSDKVIDYYRDEGYYLAGIEDIDQND
nr:MAG TPA: hypothetical protein [Microviridae sp.]